MKILEKRDRKKFEEINEMVAKTSPMRTHYHSHNILERSIWGRKEKVIKSLLSNLNFKTVIDLGCGDGELFDHVPNGCIYTGIDISPTQLDHFRKAIKSRKNKPNLIRGDILNLPFKNNSFDLAFACDVLEHVIDPIKAFKEIKRVVKKNGYVIFSIPNEFLLELARLVTFRFPLRSPDHINAIEARDVYKYFPKILYHYGIPFKFFNEINLINVLLVKNE
jgi:ubiquinone/menaquinone biosynthesis C-methylase UbiE